MFGNIFNKIIGTFHNNIQNSEFEIIAVYFGLVFGCKI